MSKVTVEIPDYVKGRVLVVSKEYIKEHMINLSMFTQKFISEVDLSSSIINIIEPNKEKNNNE